MENQWAFAVVGNIVREHTDGENIYYGTKAFTGGTKVYIYFNGWSPDRNDVYVIGLRELGIFV